MSTGTDRPPYIVTLGPIVTRYDTFIKAHQFAMEWIDSGEFKGYAKIERQTQDGSITMIWWSLDTKAGKEFVIAPTVFELPSQRDNKTERQP